MPFESEARRFPEWVKHAAFLDELGLIAKEAGLESAVLGLLARRKFGPTVDEHIRRAENTAIKKWHQLGSGSPDIEYNY